MAETEKKTLADLRAAKLPRATAADVLTLKPKNTDDSDPAATDEERRAITDAVNLYLSPFAKPNGDGRCEMCGSELNGIFGTFMWGIAHGEGECHRCHYPARAYHYVKVDEKRGEIRFALVLQYHPDELSTSEDRAARAQSAEAHQP